MCHGSNVALLHFDMICIYLLVLIYDVILLIIVTIIGKAKTHVSSVPGHNFKLCVIYYYDLFLNN